MKDQTLKRFTDTEKWSDPWFRKLPPELKCLWLMLCDRCDCAGYWEADKELASFLVGAGLDLDDALEAFSGRIEVVDGRFWLIKKFVQFQYGELKDTNPCHKAVLKQIRLRNPEGPMKDLPRGYQAPLEKEKDKDKDKEGGVGETNLELPPRFPKTEQEAVSRADSVPKLFAISTWNLAMGRSGRDAKGQPITSWPHYVSAQWSFEQNRSKERQANGFRANPITEKTLDQKITDEINSDVEKLVKSLDKPLPD